MTTTSRLFVRLLLGSAVGVSAVPAHATQAITETDRTGTATSQSDGSKQGEIVVTAQKRAERLQDVPIAVTAMSGDDLDAKGITSTLDIQNATPGLTFTTTIGTASPRIRGIGTGSALGGNENSVATYVDGVYFASSAGSVMQLENIAQVAVLKGPQGTLFGRNATGGLIQITTLNPQYEPSGRVSLTVGNHRTAGASAYLTGGLTQNIAADLSLYYNKQSRGFGINRFSGRDIYTAKDFAVRSKLLWEIGENDTLKLAGDYSTSDAAGPGRRLVDGSRPSVAYVAAGVKPFSGNPFDIESDVDPRFESRRGGGSVEYIHSFPGVDFSSLTAYRKTKTRIMIDSDATIVDGGYSDSYLRDKQFSQELQLTSTASGPLKWTLGAYYFEGEGGYLPALVGRPPNISTIFWSNQRTKAPAIYGQGSYLIGGATTLTLGARYSWEERTFTASGQNATGPGPFVPTTPISGKINNSEPSWRIAVDQRINNNLMVYASYNRGFKSGGFVPTTFSGSALTFNPETLDAYEVGFKSDLLDRKVRLNGSTFYYDYRDIQITAYGTAILPTIINATSAKIYGADFDLDISPVAGLNFTVGFSYLHSKFGTFDNAQIATPLPTGGVSIVKGSATGNKLPNTPDWTIDLGATYDIPVGAGGITVSGHFFHSDGWFAEPDNYLRQRPYNLLSGSLTWYLDQAKTFTVAAFGRNLTNQAYASQMQARASGDLQSVAAGRTFGVTVGHRF